MNRKKCFLAATITTLWSVVSFANSDLTGLVKAININKTWGGVFVQLAGNPVFEVGSGCASTWAFVPITDEYFKAFLATVTAAKVAEQPLRIATSGCMSTSVGQVAKIEWIDHGIRD